MAQILPKKYVKEETKDPFVAQVNPLFLARSRVMPSVLPIISLILIVTQVVIPLISFATLNEVSRPVSSSALGLATGFREFEFSELRTSTDVLGTTSETMPQIADFFELSIPKLGIRDALVETNAKSLNPEKALGHYTGSALPGQKGNTFIFGHSVLPFFYNPMNYKTIFSTLHTLEVGDEVIVKYNGKTLKYLVENKRDLNPIDVYPLAELKPSYLNESTMVLMTLLTCRDKVKTFIGRHCFGG